MRYPLSFRRRQAQAGPTPSNEVDTGVSCVTFTGMNTVQTPQCLRPIDLDELVALADSYAEALVSSLVAVPSEEMLQRVVSGTLLSFLADVLKVDLHA